MSESEKAIVSLSLEEQFLLLPILMREKDKVQNTYDEYEKKGKYSMCALIDDELNAIKSLINKVGGTEQ